MVTHHFKSDLLICALFDAYDNVNEIKNMYAKIDKIEFELQYTLQEKKSASEVMFFSKCVERPMDENLLIRVL